MTELAALLGVAFSDEQVAAITAPLGSALVEAAAGSGKTTVMAARVVHLVVSGQVTPGQVVGLTFTRKAAGQLRRRIAEALAAAGRPLGEAEDGEPWVATYDSFAAALVALYGGWLGGDEPVRLLDEAGRYQLASAVVAAAEGPFDALAERSPTTLAKWVLELDQGLQANQVGETRLEAWTGEWLARVAAAPPTRRGDVYAAVRAAGDVARARLELLGLRAAYAARKRAEGVTEFADQMTRAIELAETVPALRRDFAARQAVVLLDEYQDTSAAQHRLLKALFGPGPDGPGRPVLAVGDPFQAIYGWRGASASNLRDFARDFGAGDQPVPRLGLAINRRSDRAVIAAANALAAPLRAEYPAAEAEGRLVRPGPAAGDGAVETAGFLTWDEEVAWLAERIAGALAAGEAGAWREVAVLTRRNADLGPVWEALTERDIPVEIVGVGGLIQTPEVAYLLAHLRLVADPADNAALVQVLAGPRWGFSRAELAALGRRARELARAAGEADPDAPAPLAAALADPGPGLRSDAPRLAAELAAYTDLRDRPVAEAVGRLITRTGLAAELAAWPEPGGRARRAHVAAFRQAVAEYAAGRRTASLAGFLAWLDAEAEVGSGLDRSGASAEDSVKLLTVHRAKGLEWDLVFLPSLTGGVFPLLPTRSNPVTTVPELPYALRADAAALPRLAEVSEPGLKAFKEAVDAAHLLAEDRLAYVAVTRARHKLVATTHWWRAGLARPKEPSGYFLTLEGLATLAHPRPAAPGESNPAAGPPVAVDWPSAAEAGRRAATADLAARVAALAADPAGRARLDAAARFAPAEVRAELAAFDRAAAWLAVEAREAGQDIDVPLPAGLTVSQLLWARRDPAAFAAELARPWPRPPSPAARVGQAFHEWVEDSVRRPALVDALDWADTGEAAEWAEPPDAAEAPIARLRAAFAAGRFAGADPVAVEHSFALALGGLQVRGRIDAVYDQATAAAVVPDGARYLVVDWKTGRRAPDPVQLAVYRLAWADHAGVPVAEVAAGFYHVAEDRLELVTDAVDPEGLPGLVAGVGWPRADLG